jgi:hypothetical protein
MTRANLNFVWQNPGEAPRTLFHYHNGDQYPEGLLQFFGLEDFLAADHLWTPEDFRFWIERNYRRPCRKITTLPNGVTIDSHAESDEPAEPENLGEGGQPKVFYTDGFPTDYSYVFTHRFVPGRRRKDGTRPCTQRNWVSVWHYKRLIFDGSPERFLAYCRKRVEPRILPADQQAFAAVGSALHAALR